ncbi:MAG: hypothetical protein LBF39_02715 [Prevotellaceae bacterium]|jgi:hypothetical protein|nr:hypothetical protein [Prevotellaceae bacterium]
MKTNLMIIVCCLLTTFAQGQEQGEGQDGQDNCTDEKTIRKIEAIKDGVREQLDQKISEKIVGLDNPETHYVQKLNVNGKSFYTLAELMKEYGHKKNGKFDTWRKQAGKNAKYYMFYTNVEGKVYLYHEELNEEMAEQFQQYLPKGTYTFDENTYNAYFRGIDFSKNHWKEGGDVHARLADMRRLAVAVGKDLGIAVDPDKITFRLFEAQNIEGLPPTRMYIPTTAKRDDNIAGFAKWDDAVTSIEIDADKLQKGSISDVINTMVEEVYHKYQMSEIKKLQTEKAQDWNKSFNDNNRNDYGKKINDLQKQIDAEKNVDNRKELKKQQDAAIHSYYKLAHERDAKEFAGKIAAMEYAKRKNLLK